jgi:hypothetical protein
MEYLEAIETENNYYDDKKKRKKHCINKSIIGDHNIVENELFDECDETSSTTSEDDYHHFQVFLYV